MATKPKTIVTSTGSCEFCKVEIDKQKMTQHLKFCKQRLASIAAEEKKSKETKTRLFHILAEGKFNPQYWLHFELPASASLALLDDFLKDMWIDDLDHLSGFTIAGTDYSDDHPVDFFSFDEPEEEEEETSEELTQADIGKIIDEALAKSRILVTLFINAPLTIDSFSTEWISELKQPRTVDEFIDYLKKEQTRIDKEQKQKLYDRKKLYDEEFKKLYIMVHLQAILVRSILEAIEDRSMDVLLSRVLKVGQKFSYVYDYGSSTYINLRVIAERDGFVQDKKDPIQLLAQNTPPTFACKVCGKPATQVAMGYYYESIEGNAYCNKCVKKEVDAEQRMPIINSPRVGVL